MTATTSKVNLPTWIFDEFDYVIESGFDTPEPQFGIVGVEDVIKEIEDAINNQETDVFSLNPQSFGEDIETHLEQVKNLCDKWGMAIAIIPATTDKELLKQIAEQAKSLIFSDDVIVIAYSTPADNVLAHSNINGLYMRAYQLKTDLMHNADMNYMN